ncbi:hypothetical protein FBEOM_12575 [Fusarium beomiforme]|uniref:DUF7580 domain-containing protein n=1 Tax=Fusarium beomiforme TaxID=44412 RepID=A0A9P5A7I3_9HYPO|nr:hypothetical protein FBEOM_12575 [Fusarium beomiforme]
MVPADTEDPLAIQNIGFHLALSYKEAETNPGIVTCQDRKWSEVLARPAPISHSPAATIKTQSKAKHCLKSPKSNRRSKFFHSSSFPMKESTKLQANLVELESVVKHAEPSTRTSNLCMSIIMRPITPGSNVSYGRVFDVSIPKTYTYYVSSIILSKYRAQYNRAVTSLNEVLGKNRRHMILAAQDRLQLAVTISSSLLQLHGSPWMPKVIHSQAIYLIQGEDDPIRDRFFVLQSLPFYDGLQTEENTELSSMRNQPLFYLGVLLIELAFGKSIELLRNERDKSGIGSQYFTEYRTSERLVDQVTSFVGSSYVSAVSRRIDGVSRKGS